jgi:hypothetical protein
MGNPEEQHIQPVRNKEREHRYWSESFRGEASSTGIKNKPASVNTSRLLKKWSKDKHVEWVI